MKILIAEDNTISQELLKKILLTRPGYEVVVANDGQATWELLNGGLRPDLCILDIMMPKMSGLELLTKIRADDRMKNFKVILCSALRDRETISQGAALGIEYYILKPFRPDLVLQQVDKALKSAEILSVGEITELSTRMGVDEYTINQSLTTMSQEVRKGIDQVRAALTSSIFANHLGKESNAEKNSIQLHAQNISTLLNQLEKEVQGLSAKIPELPMPTAMAI
ncbi:MAG: response regulator [Verrucomicrobiota bacterium]|nr:response regulator [Verrucomicrobiota bacterium]